MYERMKRMLHSMLNVLAAALIFVLMAVYATVNGVLVTMIMNDLRLDTYLASDTGVAIVLALVMMVYLPIYVLVRISKSS